MVKYINYIFWGLLLVILHFRINNFDLLPDFIGYILVAIGAGGLINSSNQFSVARSVSWILFIFSLIIIFYVRLWPALFGLINLILGSTMMWFLLGGFSDICLAYNRVDLSEKALNRRIIYIVLSAAATILSRVAASIPVIASAAIIGIVIAMLVLLVMILHLIHQIKIMAAQNDSELPDNTIQQY